MALGWLKGRQTKAEDAAEPEVIQVQSPTSPVSNESQVNRRHSVESTLEAKVQERGSTGTGRSGSVGRIRRSLQSLNILRKASVSPVAPKLEKPEQDSARDRLNIPKPSLPGVGKQVGSGHLKVGSEPAKPVVWDLDGKPNPHTTLSFDRFRKAKTVHLSPDLQYASVRGQMFGGCVVACPPLTKTPSGRFFEIIIEEVDDEEILFDGKIERRWKSGMGIGFTTHHGDHTFPKLDAELYQTYACESLPESWLLGYDGRAVLEGKAKFLRGSHLPQGPWNPSELVVGDKVGVLATEEGHILVFVNDEHRVILPYCGVPWRPNLFPCIDLDGCTLTVSIVDNNTGKIPNFIADKKAKVCRALHFREETSQAPGPS